MSEPRWQRRGKARKQKAAQARRKKEEDNNECKLSVSNLVNYYVKYVLKPTSEKQGLSNAGHFHVVFSYGTLVKVDMSKDAVKEEEWKYDAFDEAYVKFPEHRFVTKEVAALAKKQCNEDYAKIMKEQPKYRDVIRAAYKIFMSAKYPQPNTPNATTRSSIIGEILENTQTDIRTWKETDNDERVLWSVAFPNVSDRVFSLMATPVEDAFVKADLMGRYFWRTDYTVPTVFSVIDDESATVIPMADENEILEHAFVCAD